MKFCEFSRRRAISKKGSFGGINRHGVMHHGTPEEVSAETREVLVAAEGRRLLLSTGTGPTPETTLKNLRAIVETAVR